MTFDASGVLWGISFDHGQYGTIDASTSVFSLVGTTIVKAIEFTGAVPEPGSLALTGLGELGLMALRMRKA